MDHVIPGLDYPTGPYGRMADGTYRTCPHCGTVERALAPDPHVDCDCPCHKFRKGRLTVEERNWRRRKTTGR